MRFLHCVSVAVLAVCEVALGAPCGGIACAADMPDADEFYSGSLIPAAVIPLMDEADLRIDPAEVSTSFTGAVVIAVDETDPFVQFMIEDDMGITMFFSITSRPEGRIIFAAHNDQNVLLKLRSRLQDHIGSLSPADKTYWSDTIGYASETIVKMTESDPSNRDPTVASPNVIGRILNSKSFGSVRKHLNFETPSGWVNVSRLDGFFQYVNTQDLHNHSPVNPILGNASRGDEAAACKGKAVAPAGVNIIVLTEDALVGLNCSKEKAVAGYAVPGVAVVVVLAKAVDGSLANIGAGIEANDESAFTVVGTMTPYRAELSVLSGARSVVEYTFGKGQFVAIGADFKLRQIGSPINPILAVVSWELEYLAYRKNLAAKLKTQSVVHRTEIFSETVGSAATTGSVGAFSTFTVPKSKALLALVTALEVSVDFGCPGNGDYECPVWDRIASVKVQCKGTAFADEFELTRWITPYRRSVGKWVADATHFLPILGSAGAVCNASLTGFSFAGFHEPWISTVQLNYIADSTKRVIPTTVTAMYSGGTYDVNYNANHTNRSVAIPVGTASVAAVAIITGHGSDAYGCCEFLPTRHRFGVAGLSSTWSFVDPTDKWGCTKRVSEGVEPNGYGAWWFGRDGWCNGNIVAPLVAPFAVGASSGAVNVTYSSEAMDMATGVWAQPQCSGSCGYIVMSSYLVTYATISEEEL